MAQLKSTVVNGNLTAGGKLFVLDDIIAASNLDMITGAILDDSRLTIKTKYLEIPTSSAGSTIGPGTAGQVLMTNGNNSTGNAGNIYWGTLSNMSGATSSTAGKSGLVPAPKAGEETKFLCGNGTWQTITTTDTKNTAGSTNSSSKLFLIGATSQEENPETYSHDTAYVGTDGCLYSNSKKVLTTDSIANTSGTIPGALYIFYDENTNTLDIRTLAKSS